MRVFASYKILETIYFGMFGGIILSVLGVAKKTNPHMRRVKMKANKWVQQACAWLGQEADQYDMYPLVN